MKNCIVGMPVISHGFSYFTSCELSHLTLTGLEICVMAVYFASGLEPKF